MTIRNIHNFGTMSDLGKVYVKIMSKTKKCRDCLLNTKHKRIK